MPPLSVLLGTQSLKGFEAVENPPVPPMSKSEEQDMLNPYLRCPLPPFSTTVDTIRQWNMTGKLPVMRVIPLPTQQGAGGGASSNVTNVTTTTSGSGGGSSTTPTSLAPVTLLVPVPTLLPGGTYSTSLPAAKSYQLIMVGATQPVEVRLYSNATTQAVDASRITDVSVSFNQIQGVVTDIVMDTPPYSWGWENRTGANADSPQTTKLYVTVVNPSQVASTPATMVTIVITPLES
jgi:hypothetical protein